MARSNIRLLALTYIAIGLSWVQNLVAIAQSGKEAFIESLFEPLPMYRNGQCSKIQQTSSKLNPNNFFPNLTKKNQYKFGETFFVKKGIKSVFSI